MSPRVMSPRGTLMIPSLSGLSCQSLEVHRGVPPMGAA